MSDTPDETAENAEPVGFELFREPAYDDDELPGKAAGAAKPQEQPVREPRILVVGGAKGGVGKSLFSANLGVYLATIGRQAVVVDADAGGACSHAFLGVPHPGGSFPYVPPEPSFLSLAEAAEIDEARNERPDGEVNSYGNERDSEAPEEFTAPEHRDPLKPVDVPIPGLKLLHGGIDEAPRGGELGRLDALMGEVAQLDADFVVLDLGSGVRPELLDAFRSAHVALFVITPEPTAVEGMYRFVRSLFMRHLWNREELSGEVASGLLREALAALGHHAPPPLDLRRYFEPFADAGRPGAAGLVRLINAAMGEFRFPFAVNQTRLRVDLELGERIESAARRRLGLRLEYVGYVDDDDTVANCLRNWRPLLVESPGNKASRSIEKIARRLMAIDSGKARRGALPSVPPNTHHDLLEVERGATDEEIRRAYKRTREVYGSRSLCCYGLIDEKGLGLLRARLEEAHDVLLDPARRRPYELSVFPEEVAPEEQEQDEAVAGPMPPAPVITPETHFTGALLRAVRESQGISLKHISTTTKIGVAYLEALEGDDYAMLPAQVYVRGFVTELAKCLKLDPEHVSRTYIRRYRRHFEDA